MMPLIRISSLGSGQYGTIYSAFDAQKQKVAVKRHHVSKTITYVSSIRELDLLIGNKHPYIVSLLSFSHENPFKESLSPRKAYRDDDLYFIFEHATCDLVSILYSLNFDHIKVFMLNLLLAV